MLLLPPHYISEGGIILFLLLFKVSESKHAIVSQDMTPSLSIKLL